MTTNAQADRVGATHSGVLAPLGIADAVDLLAGVVNDPGQHVGSTGTNRYTSGGEPCGVVGYALSKANVAIADLEAMGGQPLRDLYRQERMPIPITLGALIVLDAAQRSQDRGRHGDEVLDDALAIAARFLDLVSVLPSVSPLLLGESSCAYTHASSQPATYWQCTTGGCMLLPSSVTTRSASARQSSTS
jgi:hypothetical protein